VNYLIWYQEITLKKAFHLQSNALSEFYYHHLKDKNTITGICAPLH